ncbi:hypothetical protein GCK72_016406 [Caenorhabditis remanei]|uniref:Poly(A) polymerase n=1 Tax=Caenorhabditis remanei TaxID=31234 RepID=A0A6A5G543_CAERE|nr:hypothetical protein GCK72_016406 [Caenorhabditis remanei]KAF1749861.1 hypothetical protein GCK72_016406 [Caenorhabditis remanei]
MEVLRSLNRLVKEWVKNVTAIKIPSGEGANAGGKLFTFGSYRLGVHSSGADIDTLAVVPRHIDRTDFFTSFKEMLNQDPNVTELHAVEEAFVPVMKLKYSGVELDILFARLALKEVPDTQELSDDSLLKNLDQESVRSLNGCRVAEQLLKLVPRQNNYCVALRAIKLWAKNHGIYSNSMGFFGGISWAILIARACQLYPNASPSRLVHRMFFIFATWTWPHPVLLNELNSERTDVGALIDLVWDPRRKSTDRFHLMPIITPAFPQQNSTHNVTRSTMQVIRTEICEGLEICRDISEGKCGWDALFKEVNFFSRYKHYIALLMAAPNEEEELNYGGFLESRIRLLVQSLERNQDIVIAHNDPNKHKPSPNAKFDVSPENKRITLWFIGLEFVEHTKSLDLTSEIHRFKTNVELQASGVKGIGPNCTVEIDMFYVKRNKLFQIISNADLIRGRHWKKPLVPPIPLNQLGKSNITRTSSTSSVPTTPTTLNPPSIALSASTSELESTTTTTINGTPVSRKRVIQESTTTEVMTSSDGVPPEKQIRESSLEESSVVEMFVQVVEQSVVQEMVSTTNDFEHSEQKVQAEPQSV